MLVVDGVVLDKLPSGFDPDDGSSAEQRWLALSVLGSDRYVMRLDGLVFHNGAKLWNLPSFPGANWVAIAAGTDGAGGSEAEFGGGLSNAGERITLRDASGGTIVVYPETDARADLSVLHVFDEDAVDIVKLTPSHLSLLAADGSQVWRHDLGAARGKLRST